MWHKAVLTKGITIFPAVIDIIHTSVNNKNP